MNPQSAASPFERALDRSLDLLIVLILLGAPLIFYTKANDVFEFNKLTAVRAFSALAATLFLAKLLFTRPLHLTRSSTDLPLLAWLAASTVATFNTVNLTLSLHGVYEDFEGITTLVNYAFLLYLVQQQVRSERQIRMVIGAVILAGTVSGFYGMLQNFGIDFVPWNPATYSADRMFSTMGNPNFLAAYLVMSLPVCFVVFLDLPDRIKTDQNFGRLLAVAGLLGSGGLCALFNVNYFNFDPAFYGAASVAGIFLTLKFWFMHVLLAFPLIATGLLYFGRLRLILLISMVFQVVAILFTKSRGAGVSLLLIFVFFTAYFVWDSRRNSEVFKRNRYWLLVLAALVGLMHLIPQVRETTTHLFGRMFDLLSLSNFRMTPRLYIWRSALRMLQDHFWFGTGLDTFQISFPPYRQALYWILEWNGTPEKAHNMVMQIAATMGFVGLLAFFWLLVAFVTRVFKDLKEQTDSSRRLLMAGSLVGVGAFLAQNLFSFTVVGYGATFWMLMGFLPAMQRTWKEENAAESPAQATASTPLTWKLAVSLVALTGLLCLLAGTYFHLRGQAMGVRVVLFVLGLGALAAVLALKRPSKAISGGLLALAGLGFLVFSVHSVRIWVADSFYKLGQMGAQMNNPGLSAMAFQKAAGRIETITQDQERSLLLPQVATDASKRMVYASGLNPDQELYWVKMGIAFETAAQQAEKPEDKMKFFKTALAIHQLTLEMNPLNGYDYNNKGRVLKSMGDAFGYREFFEAAKAHYRTAISLDSNNVYFNLDYANTLVNLGELNAASEVCRGLMEKFPDFAMPYYYAGIIRLRQAQQSEADRTADAKRMLDSAPNTGMATIQIPKNPKADAAAFFSQALSKDWKREFNSRAIAAANLGGLLVEAGKSNEAEAAFLEALSINPEIPDAVLGVARIRVKTGRRTQALEILKNYHSRNPGNAAINAMLKQLGG